MLSAEGMGVACQRRSGENEFDLVGKLDVVQSEILARKNGTESRFWTNWETASIAKEGPARHVPCVDVVAKNSQATQYDNRPG